MMDTNRASDIAEELARAESARTSSTLLAEGGFPWDAVSRLYCSLLFGVHALLLTLGLEAKSHEGVFRLFSLHFVKTGRLEPQASHLFSRLCNPSYMFTIDDARNLRDETDSLASRIVELIRQSGYQA